MYFSPPVSVAEASNGATEQGLMRSDFHANFLWALWLQMLSPALLRLLYLREGVALLNEENVKTSKYFTPTFSGFFRCVCFTVFCITFSEFCSSSSSFLLSYGFLKVIQENKWQWEAYLPGEKLAGEKGTTGLRPTPVIRLTLVASGVTCRFLWPYQNMQKHPSWLKHS